MTGNTISAPGPAGKRGLSERYKAVRDRYRLKPVLVAVLYLIVPLATFQLIMIQYPGLDPSRFHNATRYLVPAAILLVAVALAQESYPKGRAARLALDACYVGLSLVWMVAIVGGNTVIRSEYESHPFSIDVTPLVTIGVLAAAMNLAHDVWEHFHYIPKGAGVPGIVPAGPACDLTVEGLLTSQAPASPASQPFPPAVYAASFTLGIPDCTIEPFRCHPWAPVPGSAAERSLSLVVEDSPIALPGPPVTSGRAGNTAISLNDGKGPDVETDISSAGAGDL